MEPLDLDIEEGQLELPSEPMMLNMGPSHPAMHGTVRIVLELSGESIVKADVQIGYLHRGFEKMCERGNWTQVFPYADRLNYVSPMLNNVGFSLAVEKMLGVTVPERCQYYRVILGELARICDHLICYGAMAMELGAFTPFLYFARAREVIWDIFEEETGARVTHSFGRVGGMAKPPSADFKEMVRAGVPRVLALVTEGEKLLLKNRIFLDRVEGIGAHQLRGRAGARLDGRRPALHRRPLRRAQVAPVPGLRPLRLRRPRRHQRRQLRSLHVPLGGDPAVRAHHRAGPRPDARHGPRRHRRSRASCCPPRRRSTRPSRAPSSTSRS